MTRRLYWLTVACGLLAAPTAPAQPPAPPPPRAGRLALAEDVEIMRRLLNRELFTERGHACASCHGPKTATAGSRATAYWGDSDGNLRFWDGTPRNVAVSPDGQWLASGHPHGLVRLWDVKTSKQLGMPSDAAHAFAGAEGVHLDGYGVVYTVTLPGPAIDSAKLAVKPAPRPLNEWERLRQQMHGTQAETAAPAAPREPPLRESILKLMARHGHNFAQLGPRETLTVVVTFREATPTATAHGLLGLSQGGALGGGTAAKGVQSAGGYSPIVPPRQVTTSRDHELMGDLHLKQNRAKEAADAYKNAIAGLSGSGADAKARQLYRKLAQACLSLAEQAPAGQHEPALAAALKFLQRAQQSSPAKSAAAPPARLPAKLIVSAPKNLLDQVAAGKLTFEEFRREARVEFVPSATLDKGPAPKAP